MNVAKILREKLPNNDFLLLKKIGKIADDNNLKVYLVGGIVRDLFIRIKNIDIDLTVEGNGIKFGKILSDILNGDFLSFEKFGTCKIFLKNGKIIDVASARKEFYKKSGALPEVKFSSIKDELYRRDFTINSMAISLNKNNFGDLIDFFNGENDIKRRILKVLHARSFLDDPTRILRAIRFKARFGFKIEKNTKNLLKSALQKNILKNVSVERLSNEFFLLLAEKNAQEAIFLVQKHGILKKIHSDLTVNRFVKVYFKKTKNIILRFLILIHKLNKNNAIKLAEKLKLSNYFKRIIFYVKTYQNKIFNLFKNKKNYKEEFFNIFKKFNKEVFDYFILFCKNKTIKNYLIKIKNTRIKIKGDDLIKSGLKEGVEIGKILDRIRYEKINGRIKNKKDEIKFLKRYLK